MRHLAYIVASALLLEGCHVWEQSPLTALTAATWSHDVRLTFERGARRLTLEQTSVRADSVAGVVVEAHVRRGDDWVRDAAMVKGDRVAIACRDVWSIEERYTSGKRTVVTLIAVAAGIALVAFVGIVLVVESAGET